MVTFAVDDVPPAAEALPTRPLAEIAPDALAFGGDATRPVLEADGVHPLLSAVARAFADHRPLVLSPDVVWLTIAQGIAQHIRLNAERLRPHLVSHIGRQTLTVTVTGAADWHDVVSAFHKRIEGDSSLFDCDFSTSTPVERLAGQVVALDAYSAYYSYWLVAVCGIPAITLTGASEDWQRIRDRLDRLDGLGLDVWRRSLEPITEQFARAARGEIDVDFWRRIYSPIDAYGGEVVTGWVARLYPYLRVDGRADHPNWLLDLPIGEPRDQPDPDGIRTENVPATWSRAVVKVADHVTGENTVLAVHAGPAAVAQDPDGALRPVVAWYLAPAEVQIDDVLDRIAAEHRTTPPPDDQPLVFAMAAEAGALYRRFGSAELFDGRWRIPPLDEQRTHGDLAAIADLGDGRSICSLTPYGTQTPRWVIGRLTDDGPCDMLDYGPSLAVVLEAALDNDGDISHLAATRA